MPISRTGTKRGFTTIELLVVLVVLVVMSMVVVVSMDPALRDARSRSGCRMVIAKLKYARSYSIAKRVDTRVVFDSSRNGLYLEALATDQNGETEMQPVTTESGRFRRLPDGIAISGIEKPGIDDVEPVVEFTRLGQAEDAVISLTDGTGRERRVIVDGITGRCSTAADNEE